MFSQQLLDFIKITHGDVYEEQPLAGGMEMIAGIRREVMRRIDVPKGSTVLDVGCGRGEALSLFWLFEYRAFGITAGREDAKTCKDAGHNIVMADQTFLSIKSESIDLCWVRHCLEHSPWPYMTLYEFQRVLKPGGWLYIEVPSPGTSCKHESNPNHYSVLTEEMWMSLILRAGFKFHCNNYYLDIETVSGPDRFLAMICRKGADDDQQPHVHQLSVDQEIVAMACGI